jgi:hypothetical protein
MAVIAPITVAEISPLLMVGLLSSARLWIGIAWADSDVAASIRMPMFRAEYMLNQSEAGC